MIDQGTRNVAVAGAFVDELARVGIRHACVCPGSRSTPLALGFADHGAIRVWIHVDERSAAFFALGVARALGEPVALLCSSGTAAANFLPAVVEAFYSRVPLLVLTADRPPELRDTGAPQTIDQLRLYGSHVKWFSDLPIPDAATKLLGHARTMAARAVSIARAVPAGPVHLNFPFREPLLPAAGSAIPTSCPDEADAQRMGRPYTTVSAGALAPDPAAIGQLAAELVATPHGLLICGPQDDQALASAVVTLAAALGYPVLADPLSQVRCGPHDRALVVDSYDAFLRDDAICRELAPELVLRLGALPTAKPLTLFLERFPDCRQILIDDGGGWRDAGFRVSDVIHAAPRAVCAGLAGAVAACRVGAPMDGWSGLWLTVARQTRATIAAALAREDEAFEGRVFAELAGLLPDGATLFAGNSMPVRDLETFFPSTERAIRFLANRGANGIDGVVSSALGVAAVSEGPLVLVLGDLSFYHDLNGLLAAKLHGVGATIVVLNNDGGGIFSFLPQATAVPPDRFEQLFGTPTGLDLRFAASLYGATFTRPVGWDAFRAAVAAGLARDGLSIVEVVTDRAGNVTQHRAIWAALAASREGVPVGGD